MRRRLAVDAKPRLTSCPASGSSRFVLPVQALLGITYSALSVDIDTSDVYELTVRVLETDALE